MTTLTAPARPASAKKKPKKQARKSAAGSGKKRPVRPEDMLRFRILGQPEISPDGSQIVFVEKTVGERNEYVTRLWYVPTGKGEPQPFTQGPRDSSPQWSPDGQVIAFIRRAEKHLPQLWIIPAAGGEARQLTNFPEGSIADFRWSPDGKRLAVRFREQDPEWTQKAKKQREEKGLTTPARVIDDWWYRLDGDGYFNGQRYHLYLVDAATGEHVKVYDKDTLGEFSFDFSPDGKHLALTTNRDPKAMVKPWKSEIVLLNVSTGKLKPLKSVPEGPKAAIRWSPDGKSLSYAGRNKDEDGIYSTNNLGLFVCDTDGTNARNLLEMTDYCLLATNATDSAEMVFGPNLQWSRDSKRVYVQIGWHGECHIASVPRTGGKVTFHTSGKDSRGTSGGTVNQMGNLSRDGSHMALTSGRATKLDEVHVARTAANSFKVKALTDLNGPVLAELDLAEPHEHWIDSTDGVKVHVWSLQPHGFNKGKKYPAVLEIHGGPHAQYGVGYFHEFQVLAAAGYAVFYSNPRGSKGYGRDFCAAIRGSWGGKDWEDIQSVTKFMKRQKHVDLKRMGVMGGSYGGYMTNWVIGHTDEFAGAITDRCVANLISMAGNSDHVPYPDRYWPGNWWDRPEARWNQSPLKYMGNATTPTLIIHSEGDLRCNVEQGEQVFAILTVNDVPCRFVRYPRETSHGMSRGGPPDMRIHRLGQILEWWNKYLR